MNWALTRSTPPTRWSFRLPSVTSSGCTKIHPASPLWLWGAMTAGGQLPAGSFHSVGKVIKLADFAHASSLGGRLEEVRGRTVLIAAKAQLTAALALIELDGVASRIVVCPPDLAAAHFPAVIASSGADAW